jgi:hypothetical protein
LNLLRGVACHVNRIVAWRSTLLVNAGLDRSKSTVHASRLPAFLFHHKPGTVLSPPVWRKAEKNHNLFRTMRPPNIGLTS